MSRPEKYINYSGASYSLLKSLSEHPKAARDMLLGYTKHSSSLSMGNLVDTLLTDFYSFNDIYFIYEDYMPTDKMKILADEYIAKYLYKIEKGIELNFVEDVLFARELADYDRRLKDTTVLEKFDKEATKYVEAVINNLGKLLVPQTEYFMAYDLVDSVKEDPIVGKFFTTTDTSETIFQQELYWEYSRNDIKMNVKNLLDIIWIDHANKKVLIVDAKTYEGDFERNYYKYKLYIQAELYLEGIRHNTHLIPEGYELSGFYFVAIDKTKYKGNLLYKHSTNYYAVWNGGILTDSSGRDYQIRGLHTLFRELDWHQKNNAWDYPYEYYQNNFIQL